MRQPADGPLQFGVDRLLADPALWRAWTRVGLVTNDAARLAQAPAQRSRVALRGAGVPIVRLFGPEHGLGATADDGAAVHDGVDAVTTLPVVSLYGTRMRPTRAQLTDLDIVLFDIPDVGARFYTYAWTLWHLVHACGEARVPLMVLDRPNPLGGVIASAEGPMLQPDCRSFIGEDDIPVRHSLTLGELARLWQREHVPELELHVMTCRGYDATGAWPATGCRWVATSPAMPSFTSAIWYPGTCLFEATNLSVGRGTATPFAQVGAPWLDSGRLIDALTPHLARDAARCPPLRVRPCRFTPAQGPHAQEACHGVRFELAAADDRDLAEVVARSVRPVAWGLTLLAEVMATHPESFAWARYPTAANPQGEDHLARLIGDARVATALQAASVVGGPSLGASATGWTSAPGWAERTAPVLLYPR